jgi:hypothetical protein
LAIKISWHCPLAVFRIKYTKLGDFLYFGVNKHEPFHKPESFLSYIKSQNKYFMLHASPHTQAVTVRQQHPNMSVVVQSAPVFLYWTVAAGRAAAAAGRAAAAAVGGVPSSAADLAM